MKNISFFNNLKIVWFFCLFVKSGTYIIFNTNLNSRGIGDQFIPGDVFVVGELLEFTKNFTQLKLNDFFWLLYLNFEYQWFHNCIHNFEKKKNSMQLQDNLSRINRENPVSDKPFDIANKFSY